MLRHDLLVHAKHQRHGQDDDENGDGEQADEDGTEDGVRRGLDHEKWMAMRARQSEVRMPTGPTVRSMMRRVSM